MIRTKKAIKIFLFSLALLNFSIQVSQAQSPQEILTQYISDLQKNPDDNALREKIIRHVQSMSPAPSIPEEARRNYVMAKTLFKDARNVQDYNDALAKFKAAVLTAPWWADAYLDMGLSFEAAQQYNEAISALKLFIVASTDSEKSRKAQDEIYIIEAKKEKAAKEASPAAEAEKKMNEEKNYIRKLNGVKFVRQFSYPTFPSPDCGGGNFAGEYVLEIQDNEIVQGVVYSSVPRCYEGLSAYRKGFFIVAERFHISGRAFLMPRNENSCNFLNNKVRCSDAAVTIAEDAIHFPANDEILVYRRKY